MALLVQFLLLAILGTCICEQMPEMEMEAWPKRVNLGRHIIAHAQGPTAGTIAPTYITLTGHVYDIDGDYKATDQRYNGYPVYRKSDGTPWSVYLRHPTSAIGVEWVADWNEVDDKYPGTAAYWSNGLFNSDQI